MARIRSVHPALFTDEAWVSCSPFARLLIIGLWTDADDQGVFEWKPLQIKMRLLPGDAADVPALMAELADVGLIRSYEEAGKRYGAIRNFRKFQRPKKPNAIHPLPHELREYVCLGSADAEPAPDDEAELPNQLPTSGEKSPQMEDGGGRREEISEAIASSVAVGEGEGDFEALWKAYPHVKGRSSKPKSRVAWAYLDADIRKALPTAASRFKAEGVMPQSGPCALERWLDEARFIDWLEAAVDWTPSACLWRGPNEIREAFLAEFGHDWVRTYLDRCAWQDVPERALIPATGVAAAKIRREARSILAQLNLTVLEKAA